MNNISVISVGGTFEKEYNKGTGIINYSFGNKSKVEDILKLIRYGSIDINFPKDLIKDSTEMTDSDRSKLFLLIKKIKKPVVLIHGTDTMIKTARYLFEKLGKEDRLIILTGASVPWVNKNTDAEFNLGGAIAVAQTGINGVYIFMNGRLFNPFKCKKNSDGIFKKN
jgi:L-asparaginase